MQTQQKHNKTIKTQKHT